MDELLVLVECRDKCSDEVRVNMANKLQDHVKTHIGISTGVNVVNPGGVERSQGKAKRVVDKRNLMD